MSSENIGASTPVTEQPRSLPPAGTYPPYPYYQPYAYYPPPMAAQLSSWAIASLICGIVGVTSLNIIAAGLGAIFGHVALREIKSSNGWREGRGMALAGTITGYVGVGLALLIIGFYVLYLIFIFSVLQSIPTSSPSDFIGHLLSMLHALP